MHHLNTVCWSGVVGQYCPLKHYPSPGFLSSSLLLQSLAHPHHLPITIFSGAFLSTQVEPALVLR